MVRLRVSDSEPNAVRVPARGSERRHAGVRRIALRICAVGLAGLALVSCDDLGEPALSESDLEIVYFYQFGNEHSGVPYFAGQAYADLYCADGRCHDGEAAGGDRFLVPAGFDFSMRLACTATSASDESCTDDTAELLASQRNIDEHRALMWAEVRDGTMPPEGFRRDLEIPYYRGYSVAGGGTDPLPDLFSEEGLEFFRIWLASGAPVVQHAPFQEGGMPTASCGSLEVGQCRLRAPAGDPIEPNWPSIYRAFAGTTCVSECHEPDSDVFEDSLLDLSDEDTAYDSLVNVAALGDCAGDGNMLVVPNEPENSVLIQKMEQEMPTCGGDQMPLNRAAFSTENMAPIRAWIEAGAPRTP